MWPLLILAGGGLAIYAISQGSSSSGPAPTPGQIANSPPIYTGPSGSNPIPPPPPLPPTGSGDGSTPTSGTPAGAGDVTTGAPLFHTGLYHASAGAWLLQDGDGNSVDAYGHPYLMRGY